MGGTGRVQALACTGDEEGVEKQIPVGKGRAQQLCFCVLLAHPAHQPVPGAVIILHAGCVDEDRRPDVAPPRSQQPSTTDQRPQGPSSGIIGTVHVGLHLRVR